MTLRLSCDSESSQSLYFFISYPRIKRENQDDIYFVVPEDRNQIPKCIYMDESHEDKGYYYQKIFMVNKSATTGKKANNYYFEFEIDDDKYIITFDSKGASFVYDVKLEKTKRMITILRKIDQNFIKYYDKMHFFVDALKRNNEENKINLFFKDTIELFSIKKSFSFLIELFVEIYKNKDLCELLLKKFKEMNVSQKESGTNLDREPFLEKHKPIFNSIISEVDNYNYDIIEFYGVILCYLHYYDSDNFSKTLNELFNTNSEKLFEVMLIYNSHFQFNPINQNFDFFQKFIEYTILEKDHAYFERGLEYIRDIETYIAIIEKEKDNYFTKYIKDNKEYLKNIIKLDDSLKKIKAENAEQKPSKDKELTIQIKDEKEADSNSKAKSKKEVEDNKRKFEKNIQNHFIIKMIKNIESLIRFCREKKTFLIYFTTSFWKYILNNFNEPNQNNIYICSKLRDIFIKYNDLVNEIFAKKDKKFSIKNDSNNYYELDEFAYLLDQIIKKYIISNRELENIEKLAFITQYNPYYKDKKNTNNMDINIFDLFNLNNIDNDQEFIGDFRNMEFEIIFKKNINEYINKILSKIKKISDFDNVIKLINIKKIDDKNIFLNSLSKTYEQIIKNNEIEKKLKNYQILARLSILFFNYDSGKNRFKFIDTKIKKLDRDIIPKIFIEIMRLSINKKDLNEGEKENKEIDDIENEKVEDFDKMKEYILKQFINFRNEKDIENIISLIDCLEGKKGKEGEFKETNDKKKDENREIINEFLNKLLDEKNLFKKEEFFSSNKSLKILLLSRLNEKGIIQKNDKNEYYNNLQGLMKSIKEDLEGNINKKTFDEFLKIDESIIKQRLNLLSIILEAYNSDTAYKELKETYKKINDDINKLIDIKDNIIIYHRETYKDKIKELIDLIKDNQNKKINEYKSGKIKEFIRDLDVLSETIDQIKKVKNNLLFNVIYEYMNLGKSEGEHFNNSVEKLDDIKKEVLNNNGITEIYNNKEYKNIFNIIKEKLSTNEKRAIEFIDNLKDYFGLVDKNKKDKKEYSGLIKDLTILFKIKKYEMDINSIIFFFDLFPTDNKQYKKDNELWDKKLDKKKFENLFRKKENEEENPQENDFQNIKQYLTELKDNGIYNYDNIPNYNKVFTCLYNKKEAIDFLFSKIGQDISYLYNRIQPTDRTISIADIKNTEFCISVFGKMKERGKKQDIYDLYIKNMDVKDIPKFENYSRVYSSVIELDTFYDDSENLYDEVNGKIKDNTFNIYQDEDDFKLEDLIHLKNKIHIKNENVDEKQKDNSEEKQKDNSEEKQKDNSEEKQKENLKEKQLKFKCKILIFFKKFISELEAINSFMKVLRSKGSSLPIKISIKTKIINNEPSIEYYLDNKKTNFEKIRNFLFKAKNNYISQINSLYKTTSNLRFLYGKQFRSVMKHLESNLKIDSFLRYIINNKDNNKPIKEGFKATNRNAQDYINQYELYNKNSLESISTYINTVFDNNGIEIEDHFSKMKIIFKDRRDSFIKNNLNLNEDCIKYNNKCKGIYLHECENNSMEKYILNLYWDKMGELPIAQNVLIANKETSPEEIQAFFYRAILCNYNILFVVEINDSFSDYQQGIINGYIANLLSLKYNNYQEKEKEDIDRKKTGKYLDSCIVFIYDKENKKITSFLNEIKKYEIHDIKCNDIINNKKDKFLSDLGNIKVITSDICGLGKTEKIKKMIRDENKKYFHFPLGGILSKDIIFNKLDNLLNRIKIDIKEDNYKEIAIHLDLTESEEISIINEFFFSFLVTKFYINNESIIYIPKDISIYIEVPNCFEDYLSKFGILSIFNKENITVNNMPKFNYPENIINLFKRMLEINTNDGIQKFVSKYFEKIDIKKYSFHQINMFIKLFISQYSKFKGKLTFWSDKKDVTEKCIEDFSKSTRYFTNGGFAKLLTGTDNIDRKGKDSIDILSDIYENDLAGMTFPDPLIFINKEKMKYEKIYIPTKDSKDSEKYKNSKDFLQRIKEALDLPNEVEKEVEKEVKEEFEKEGGKEVKTKKIKYKSLLSIIEDNNYVITIDNYKKMVLLVYRIKANVPVILMGETGCGKTALITKLNQILNNGETNVEIINIHPGITDEKLCDYMEKVDAKAKEKKTEELWVFFDEMNTCLSLSLLTEIFINRTYNGNKLSDNIRLIGACNPYRRRKGNKEKCGISISEDNDKELVYLVQPLPQSLLYYVFSFGRIDDNDEKKYIHSIIEKLFSEDEKHLYEITTEAISECHKYLRKTYDASVVSLREISRFSKCMEFFQKYFSFKNENEGRDNNERNNKIRSIICSIYICYFIRLTNDKIRSNFDIELRHTLLKLININFVVSVLFNNIFKATKLSSIKLNEFFNSTLKELKESIKNKSEENNIKQYSGVITLIALLNKNEIEKEEKLIGQIKDDILKKKNSIKPEEIINMFITQFATLNEELKKKIEEEKEEKLIDQIKDGNLKNNISEHPEEAINSIILKFALLIYKVIEENAGGNLINDIIDETLKKEISNIPEEKIDKNFSDFIKNEQDYILNKIELDKGIGKNTLLKENVFLLFLSVVTSIPLIIIGKPGSGKSLSAQLINKSMKGIYSKNKFFKKFPKIIQTYFQGSESTEPVDVENLFDKAKNKLDNFKKKKEKKENKENKDLEPISMILFDELGLAENSKSNPLKVLHSKLEYSGKDEGVSFVGISNYSLDAAKVNRALILSVPDLDERVDELIQTSYNIVESISEKLKSEKIFEILSNTYFNYKKLLDIIKNLIVYKEYLSESRQQSEIVEEDDINKNLDIDKAQNLLNTQLSKEKNNKNENEIVNDNNNSVLSIISKTSNSALNEEENNKSEKEAKNLNKAEKGQFENIKQKPLFKYLFKKENKIRRDFHGNRDFYNLIKGIAIEFGRLGNEFDENDKLKIIEKYIERNLGGIDYEIDIDYNNDLDDTREDINLIKDIVRDYNGPNKKKLNSVYLFKKLYNLEFAKEDPNSRLIIKKDKLMDYNLNYCINDNIIDTNSRFLLLETKRSLTTIICQNIKLQNPYKEKIIIYDGSPFTDDDNKEYRFMILNQIQENAREDCLIILENLNQIHPFLFDLYNMNYIIKDEKKFARVCLEDKFNEQLTEVNDRLRIIVLADKIFVEKVNLAFLNRFEKMALSFDKLLDNELIALGRSIINEMSFRKAIKKYEDVVNYSLRDLLINCREEEIQGLIYYYSNKLKKKDNDNGYHIDNKKEKELLNRNIRENVYNKIYKILPQDIIFILPDNNVIKRRYIENKDIHNFKDYIKKEENKKYKISIIYTYTGIANIVEGLDTDMRIMISEINSENALKNAINEIIIKNENNKLKKDYNKICIHFDISNSRKIKYVSNFILKHFKEDKYNYIFIIHINRDFKKKKEKIYSLSDINDDINQMFIDNLNGNNSIRINDLLGNNIINILDNNRDSMKLDEEFNKILTNFLLEALQKSTSFFDPESINDYINEIQDYIKNESSFKEKIIEITNKFIEQNINGEEEENMIENILKNINIYDIDIVSSFFDYIKNNIFNKYLKIVFEILENNNILTTLLEIKRNNYKYIKDELVEEIINKYLDEISIGKDKKYEPKFLFNYNVPGFYEFYVNISNYINKNISAYYFTNEKKFRELLNLTFEKENDFHEQEQSLLSTVYKEVEKNNKFIFEFANKIDKNIIFQDYITYYLQKYYIQDGIYKNDDIYHKIIELLLKLRFDNKKIIKDNENSQINVLLIKIIWIESNVNYILNIIKIVELALEIFNNDENKLYKKIDELISKKNIKYITKEKRNPKHTKEVNECYYIFLATICYCITSEDIKLNNLESQDEIEIHHYYSKLKEINKNLQVLNNNLYIYLNEMYIIDELVKVIELLNYNIEKISKIKNLIRESALIMQKYDYNDSDNSNQKNDTSESLLEELNSNFENIYDLIKEEKDEKVDNNYYDKLRYILFKEIKKTSNINYRSSIFEKLLEENQIIKKSNEIFQFLLKSIFTKFENANNYLLNGNEEKTKQIAKLIDIKLNADNNFILTETLLYFFEKNSLIYLKQILKNKNIDDEPLKILEECIKFLDYYISKPKSMASKLKELSKLFCLAYIKTFSYSFIKMFDEKKDHKKIIEVINGNNSICKMIRIYIYKILYNNYSINIFINEKSIDKYKLKDYKDFDSLIKKDELINIYKIDYEVKTLKNDEYDDSYKKLDKCKNDQFKKKLNNKDYDIEDIGIDNFYAASYNLILSDLKNESYSSEINKNFYNNICMPLLTKKNLLKAVELLYSPKKYEEIKKKYEINSNNILPILYGYRYVLNELSSENENNIYYSLYEKKNFEYLESKFYPGNNIKYNRAYSNIINHFKFKSNEGCYVCLCKNWYYHSIPSGFPGSEEVNMKCPNCEKPIGSEKKGFFGKIFSENDINIVKRDNYFRIFKDDKEIAEIKKNAKKKDLLHKINYMTLEEFKEKYIYNSQKTEKGVLKTDKNNFKNDDKVVRNLSQVSYRILNYILYTHLFFARIITDKKDFENYLPEGMNFVDTLYECWIILKNELSKVGIYSVDKFLNYIFVELFPKLNGEECINDYERFIIFEDELEKLIQENIKKFKEENRKYNLTKKNIDCTSLINLLKENYSKEHYDKKEFPFYEYFYYSDYLNENYINEKLEHMDESKYPVLKKYIEYLNNNHKDKYSLDNLNLFNKVLNLYFEKYSNNVSRANAEKKLLKEEDIYINNKKLIDSFFELYNNLEIKPDIKLSNESHLKDLFITDDSIIGKSYKEIYKKFANKQNEKIEKLLENKIQNGIFDNNYRTKINIQQAAEKEIFTFKLSGGISFTEIIFNSSYRKILDGDFESYESYKEYVINYDMIEEIMTDNLLKNKKLFNDDNITEIIYNNEVFSNEVTNCISLFNEKYNCKTIGNSDKISIYSFYMDNSSSTSLFKEVINDFITLIKFLNDKKNEGNDKDNDIQEESKISEVINKIKDRVSNNFIKLFENNDGLTINKITGIFEYYLKAIYEVVNNEMKKYKQELNKESKDQINKYYQKQKSDLISKNNLACAIRLFITLVLFLEEEKDRENKIKNNSNNVINYLKPQDLWSKDVYDQNFNKNLNELKIINVPVKQIIGLYEYLGNDIGDDYFDDIKKEIEDNKNANAKKVEDGELKEVEEMKVNKDDPFTQHEEDEVEDEDKDNNDDDEDDPFAPKEEEDENGGGREE